MHPLSTNLVVFSDDQERRWGLDVGVTANLNRWGQLVLIVGMFTGRLGVILLLSALYGRRPRSRVGYPREEVLI